MTTHIDAHIPDATPMATLSGQLPSPARLRRATVAACIVALTILVVVVLPAERGIDPTGLGRIIGLKAMGDYKMEAARYQAAVAAFAAKRAADSAAAAADTVK